MSSRGRNISHTHTHTHTHNLELFQKCKRTIDKDNLFPNILVAWHFFFFSRNKRKRQKRKESKKNGKKERKTTYTGVRIGGRRALQR